MIRSNKSPMYNEEEDDFIERTMTKKDEDKHKISDVSHLNVEQSGMNIIHSLI